MSNFFSFALERKEQILSLLVEHTFLTMLAISLAILIGIPLGILITNIKPLRKPILGLINTLQAVPSMALLGLLDSITWNRNCSCCNYCCLIFSFANSKKYFYSTN